MVIRNPTPFCESNKLLQKTIEINLFGTVWVRVENSNGCFSVSQIDLIVSATQINAATFQRSFTLCDDAVAGVSLDTDGTSVFNFSSVTNDINIILPPPSSNYTIKYYANQTDALAQVSAINEASYRNTVVNQQHDGFGTMLAGGGQLLSIH